MAILFCKLVEAETNLDELIAMKEFFQDVRMIGIGEATHGLGVFFKLRF